MNGTQMKLSDDAKRSFDPEKLGFKRIGGGRKSYSSNDACEAYMLITPQKSGNRQIDACRVIISHDIANKIISSLGDRVAVSLNDTGSLMLSSGNDRQLSEQGKHDRRISLDSFAPLFMKVLGGHGKYAYEVQTIEDGIAFIFSPKNV